MDRSNRISRRARIFARFGVMAAVAAIGLLKSGQAHALSLTQSDNFEDPAVWHFFAQGTSGGGALFIDQAARSPTHVGVLYMNANSPLSAYVLMQAVEAGPPVNSFVATTCSTAAYIKSLGGSSTRARGKLQMITEDGNYISSQSFNFAPDGVWHRVQTNGSCANSLIFANRQDYGAYIRIVIDSSDTAQALSFFAVDDVSFSINYTLR